MWNKPFIASALILALGWGAAAHLTRGSTVKVVDNRLKDLPLTLEEWKGEPHYFTDAIYQELNTDANLYRLYTHPDGRFVWLYIGYYGTQKGGRAKHQPQYCYPSSGWDIVNIAKEQIDQAGNPVTANLIVVKKDGQFNQALYWNHAGNNRVIHSGLELNLNRFLRRLTENRDDGAFIRISASFEEGGEDVLRTQKEFARLLLQRLPQYWPVEG